MSVPEAVGGLGLSMLDEAIIGEEFGYGCMGIYTILMASSWASCRCCLAATPEQQQRFLAPLVEGPRLAAFALSEPNNGSDAGGLRTRAVFDGDEIVITGTKTWISNGGVADFSVVFASFDPALKHKGTVAVVVGVGPPGPLHQQAARQARAARQPYLRDGLRRRARAR